jgi:hypothetical protein
LLARRLRGFQGLGRGALDLELGEDRFVSLAVRAAAGLPDASVEFDPIEEPKPFPNAVTVQ